TLGAGATISAASGGIVAPGASIGTLTLDGSGTTVTVLSLANGAIVTDELNNPLSADQIKLVNGAAGDIAFNAGGSGSTSTVINFSDLSSGSLAAGQYVLFSSDVAGGAAYSGLTLAGDGVTITGGLTIGSGLGSYP